VAVVVMDALPVYNDVVGVPSTFQYIVYPDIVLVPAPTLAPLHEIVTFVFGFSIATEELIVVGAEVLLVDKVYVITGVPLIVICLPLLTESLAKARVNQP
jgi:hypothetical protein